MRSSWIMAGPIPKDKCPCQRREEEKTGHREEGHACEGGSD